MSELIHIRPYDWVVHKDEKIYDPEQNEESVISSIYCWALDNESKPYLLRINDFPITCFLELPTVDHRGRRNTWNKSKVDDLMACLRQKMYRHPVTEYTFAYHKKTYYYRKNNSFPMVLLQFTTIAARNAWKRELENPFFADSDDISGVFAINVWETDIDPIRKMLTCRSLEYSGWLSAYASEVDKDMKVSKLEREYIASYRDISPTDKTLCANWTTSPLVLCFDIESYSDNHRAMPNKMYAKHVAHMISCVCQRVGMPETRRSIGIVLGDCDQIPEEVIKRAETIVTCNEMSLIDMFCQVVSDLDPEIISGYNIDHYDWDYLNARRVIHDEPWPNMTRLIDGIPVFKQDNWSSSGYGSMNMSRLIVEGRISVDMYTLIKRDNKLEKYTLDFVSKHFIPGGAVKHDVTAVEMFEIYEQMTKAITDRKTLYNVKKQIANNPDRKVRLPDGYDTLDQYERDVEDQYDQAKAHTTKVLAYCIQDSELVMNLIDKLNTWIGLVEMSNIMGVPIVDLFTRGQQVRCMSQLYDLAARKGYVIDHRDAPAYTYKGGFVGDPIPGKHDFAICLDFNSLYPSIIMAYNICWTTLVPPELMDSMNLDDVNVFEFDQEEDIESEVDESKDIFVESTRKAPKKNGPKITRHYKFMFYKKTKGILPTLVETLVNKRKETNKVKNTLNEYSLMYQILEKRQLALKVSANSLYGFLGADKNGKMPLLEGAMAITFMGRTNINIATQYMVDEYGAKFIYSDTDSSMVTLPAITSADQCQYWGERLAQEISGWNAGDPLPGYGYRSKQFPDMVHKTGGAGKFPPPLRMEFEKAMRILCLCKKKYAYFKIEPDGSFKKNKDGKRNYIEKKGIILARRGNPMHLQRTYENILYNILSEGDLESSLDILTESAEKLIAGEVPIRDLVAIRELGANYKQEEFFMNVFAKSLLSQGVLVAPGDRLGFIIVDAPPPPDKKDLLGYKMRLIEKYEESEVKEPISIGYYLEKILTNPIDQLIGIGHRLELLNMFHVSYLPPRKRKCIYLDEPMKMIYYMYLAGKTVQDFRNYVDKGFQYARLPRVQFSLEDE